MQSESASSRPQRAYDVDPVQKLAGSRPRFSVKIWGQKKNEYPSLKAVKQEEIPLLKRFILFRPSTDWVMGEANPF